jgi:barstar (barnase inhibitor)
MKMAEQPFIFADMPESKELDADFVIKIPANISSKESLFSIFEREGHFPNGFGGNWDALLDCLRDLSWISGKRVMILHESLPLKETPKDCDVYLGILSTAVADWKQARSNKILPAVKWQYVDHELVVFFPLSVKEAVAEGRLRISTSS